MIKIRKDDDSRGASDAPRREERVERPERDESKAPRKFIKRDNNRKFEKHGNDRRFDRRDGERKFDRRDGERKFDRRDGERKFDKRDGDRKFDRRDGERKFDRRDGERKFDRRDGQRRFDKRDGDRKFERRDNDRKFEKRGGPRNFDKRDGDRKFDRRPKRDFQDNRGGSDNDISKSEIVTNHRFNDISELDREFLYLLEKRAFLIRKEGAWRKSRQKSLVDPKLEKLLRSSFDTRAGELGLDAKLTKQLFTLLNQFSLADARKKFTGDAYKLAPRVEAISAGITGPRSFRYTRMLLAMAASAGVETTLAPVTMNAPNKDLAKALKQAGAPISWDDDFIKNAGGRTLGFEGNMIFVGEDPFNFYMLLCLALAHAGRCKFTGKPSLQLLDINGLNKVLPKLGARLVAMNPNNPGLPARLECGGAMDEEVTLPGSIDPDFAAALTLAAWSFPGGLTINGLSKAARERVAEAVDVLTACGINAELSKDSVKVSDGMPKIDGHPRLPLSMRLCSVLLALPFMAGGSINIEGTWPKSEKADKVLEQFRALGLRIDVGTENIIATMDGEVPANPVIALGEYADLQPLAMALALKLDTATLTGEMDEVTVELLDRMGVAYDEIENGIEIKPGERSWSGTWFSPDPLWSMGCALAGYSVPGIKLENHGEVTATWPEFWNFYNSLPTGKMKPKPVQEKKDDKRRRIKIR
ncbi:chorismate mutase [Pseudodesulfovibrio sp. zrk46]|uniref:chorismate mutase n=1 Tax=Pseudodesulfovibrio sp. zrk46 TaxID=2725288 RepID=UPI001449204A|nr:chorismate mutase [Pseudodesulfovibrio sp. zrk46]QJB56357.1 chorismate mutase [Pseudodesulfovibrio sp. zrk46]